MTKHMAELLIGNVYGGFRVDRIRYVEEVSGKLYELEHIKSGAKLIYLGCDDDNKVFSVMFKTIPEDSTGVFHIIEHSVLCGSKRYPVKEPFVDLLKGSMATFLNALTFPDKTGYPVASCNDKDFKNLMGVYLDAVFAPNFYEHEEIFMQEGWHYEIEGKDKPMSLRGVVFNEMKGAYSSVDTQMFHHISEALFPDTLYRHSSGGDPGVIPDLTYEQFLAAHKKYYHPENSFIFLYGNMDVVERLEYLDREYLSKYTRTGNVIDIPMQKPTVNHNKTGVYSISDSESEEKNSYITFASVVADFSEREKVLAFDILMSILASTNESPLKKAVLESGLGEDLWAFIYDGVAQPYVIFELRKTDPDKKDEFISLLRRELEKLVKDGIDKKLITAQINQTEFALREGKQGSMPAGLLYNFDIMSSWLYGGDPAEYIEYEKALENIKKGTEGRYFEELIEKYILDSDHNAIVLMTPSKTIAAEQAKAEEERVASFRNSLSDEELEKIVEKNKKLIAHQTAEDTPEQLATLPKLSVNDVGDKITEMPFCKENYFGRPMLTTELFTKKIAYVNFYFDISGLSPELLPFAALYAELLGQISTSEHTAAELDTAIKTKLGSLGCSVKTFVRSDNIKNVLPSFVISTSMLEHNMADALALVFEVASKTVIDKEEVRKLLLQTKSMMQMMIMQRGDRFASARVKSYCSVEGAYNDRLGGIGYYRFLSRLCNDFDSEFDRIKAGLEAVAAELDFDRLTVGITGERSAVEGLVSVEPTFNRGTGSGRQFTLAPEYKGNEAFIVPSGVNYVAKGFNFEGTDICFSGKMNVLSNILSLDWLWNEVRVRGGAYGVGFSVSRTKNAVFGSFRDPSVKATIETYDKTLSYLNGFAEKVPDIEKYIISTAAAYERPLCPKDIGATAQTNYFEGYTDDMRRESKKSVLETTPTDIENMSALIKPLVEKQLCAVVGNKEKIEEAGDLFTIKEDL